MGKGAQLTLTAFPKAYLVSPNWDSNIHFFFLFYFFKVSPYLQARGGIFVCRHILGHDMGYTRKEYGKQERTRRKVRICSLLENGVGVLSSSLVHSKLKFVM